MKVHKTTDSSPTRPVLYRHAKCKNCDHKFRYHLSAAPNRNATRPPCPNCDEQGISGPFGRTNPAEWLPIIQQVAAESDSEYEYADWLAGEAALYKPAQREHLDDTFVFVDEPKAYLPCRITKQRNERGVDSGGFGPAVYAKWLANDAPMELVDSERVPDRQPVSLRSDR